MSVLITGGSSGLGLSLAKYFSAKGRELYVCGRNADKLSKVLSNIPEVTALCFDITDKENVLSSAQFVDELEVLILNAGDCEYYESILPFDSDKFERIIKVNLLGMAYCLEAYLDKLKPGGQLVIVSSSAVLLPFPKAEAYGASKAACSYLAKSLAVDLKKHDISVTLVEPGFVQTALTDKNTFTMPFLVPLSTAGKIIGRGIEQRKPLIRFPTRLMALLHLFALLPLNLWAKIINRNH